MSLRGIEAGDPRVHPSKIERGAKFWRWTVVRHAAPEKRSFGRKGFRYAKRVLVRCVCHRVEQVVWEVDLTRGLTTGCRSATCRRVYDEAIMSKIEQRGADIIARLRIHEEAARALEASIAADRKRLAEALDEARELEESIRHRARR